MELGVCLAAYGGTSLRTALDEVAGFGSVSLDLPTDSTLGLVDARRCQDDADYRAWVGRLAGSGPFRVTCVSNSRDTQLLLGPHGPHTDPVLIGSVAEKRAHARRCALGTVRLAEHLGVDSVRLQVGCPDFGRWLSWWGSDVSWLDNVEELFVHVEPVLLAAREAGVMVLLEPHPKQILYDRPSAEMIFTTAPPALAEVLGLCIDPANLAATGHDPVAAVSGWGERLIAVHAKDLERWAGSGSPPGRGWCRYGPQPPIRFRSLGLGEMPWRRIVSHLIDEGFNGVIYAEHEDALLPRQQGITQTLGLLRSMLPAGPAEGRTW